MGGHLLLMKMNNNSIKARDFKNQNVVNPVVRLGKKIVTTTVGEVAVEIEIPIDGNFKLKEDDFFKISLGASEGNINGMVFRVTEKNLSIMYSLVIKKVC